MASGLSIVIDTRNAELNIKNLNQALERLENQGNSIANMMRNLGSNNPFAALTASINVTKSDFNALAASANLVKSNVKEMGDALVYAKTTLTGAATAATTFQAAMRGIGNSLNTAQAAMARFNQSGQSIANVLNTMNGASGSNGVNNLNNAIKQLNPNIAALNNETKAVTASLRAFSTAAIAAEAATLKLDVALLAARANMATLSTTTVAADAALLGLQGVFSRLQTQAAALGTSIAILNRNISSIPQVNNAAARSANTAAQSTALFQRSAQGLESTLMRLQTLMTGGLFGMVALSIAKTADTMQGLESQVRLVTQGEEQREEVQRRLLVIANKNFADIEATTGSYQRNAFALAQLGKSQMDVLNFTDALSLAMRTGGRSMVEQKSAVYQLSQAMGAGKLMGDEFRALSENAPIILKYIAKEMGVAQGALKELGSEGKITSEIIYNAMMKARPEMEKMAQSLPITMSQAWQQVNNSYKTFIDNFMNGTSGMSQGIASMLQGIGKNFDTVIKGMTIAGGLAFVGFASKIDIATKSMALFNFVANANPFVRMATIILAVSSAFYGLDDVINTTSVIMGDLIHMITDGWTGIFNLIGDGLNSLQGVVAQNNDDIGKSYKDMFTNATTDHDKFIANATFASNNLVKTISADNMKNEQSYFGFYSRTQKGFLGFVEFVGTAVIATVSTLGGFFKFIFNGIEDTLKRMGNALMTAEEWIQKKLGNNVQYKRYDTFNNLSADQSYADVNSAGQKAWHDIIMGWADKINSKQPTVNGMPPSMDYKPPVQTPSGSDGSNKDKKGHQYPAVAINNIVYNHAAKYDYKKLEEQYGLPSGLLASISMAESRGNPNATSPVGAKGEFQFMPATAKRFGIAGQERNTEVAAVGAAKYLSFLLNEFGDINKAIAGYNAGEGNVRKYKGIPPFKETQDYVKRVRGYLSFMNGGKDGNYSPNTLLGLNDKSKDELDKLNKAREDYIASIATGEAKINAQLNKAIADLPSKGFSGQALEDEKKRLTEEAEFDRLLSRETNRQKLDELMAVHKTKKDQILDESYLQGLTIAADESKSREQRKAELEALDVGTKEKIRLNDIANKYELGKIWAFRKTSSELIADEWDEKIQAAMNGNDELKDEYIASYKEQKQLALDIDKLNYQQQLLDLQKFNMADIAYLEQTLKIKNDLVDRSNATQAMKDAQKAANEYETYNSVYDTRKSANDGYMSTYFDLYGQKDKYEAYKGVEDKRIAQNDAVQKALDAGIIQHEEYYQTLKDIDAQYVASKQAILVGGYQSIFGSMTSLMSAFGGEQSRAYRIMANIEKGYALYSALLSEKVALGKAWASAPFPQNLVAVAKVALESSSIIGAINSFAPKGFSTGGYTGNMGVNDVAGVVHGKEYVLNAAATKRIGVDNLNAMNKGASIGNNNVSVNVVVNADGSSDVQANAQIGKQMGDAIKAAVLQTIVQEKRQGGLLAR